MGAASTGQEGELECSLQVTNGMDEISEAVKKLEVGSGSLLISRERLQGQGSHAAGAYASTEISHVP